MSFNSVQRAAADTDLQQRIIACANQQAHADPDLAKTIFGQSILNGYANYNSLYWGVANSVDQQYESGILAGRGSPGYDQDVVTDGAILAAVVFNWPPDPPGASNPVPTLTANTTEAT